MKLIKNLFKKQTKVFYSCVIDDDPKFYWQGYIFVNSLIKLAKVDGSRIFVHMTAKNDEFEKFLSQSGVNVKFIEPWGDKKYCNKLQQLETKELKQADFVYFCDADIAITTDLAYLVKDTKTILGKVVDFDNPDLDTLKKIYDIFKLDYPKITHKTLNNHATFETNFNGGLYGIPTQYLEKFSSIWKDYALKMLNSENIANLLGKKINHIDQISFSLTLHTLKTKYQLLEYKHNCPMHIKNIDSLKEKITQSVEVVHYHSNLSSIGLLNSIRIALVDESINKVNQMLKDDFNNQLFWNYRYKTNPELGSGVGSRGEVAQYKLELLKLLGIEQDDSVLDIGCGDLEIVKNLNIRNYTGTDISEEALKIAKSKYPQHKFINIQNISDIQNADTVMCLDVLIHQGTFDDYQNLVSFAASKAKKRLIISGYENAEDSSHMCFFYEDIATTLHNTKQFKYIFKVGEYRGLGIYVADKGELLEQNTKNDIKNSVIESVLRAERINKDLLLESIIASRNTFGWFTKHYPRLYEYPWLLNKVGRELNDICIADFGAGVTPLPMLLANRGANVYTVDKHSIIRRLDNVKEANEWGFFDYGAVSNKIKSFNASLDENTFKNNSLDIWYSISVVEHMPAQTRRAIFKIMADSLKNDGKIYLTIDLVKNSTKLWNMSEGKEVEDAEVHGTLESFVEELEVLGFNIDEKEVLRMPKDERVDIALISGVLKK